MFVQLISSLDFQKFGEFKVRSLNETLEFDRLHYLFDDSKVSGKYEDNLPVIVSLPFENDHLRVITQFFVYTSDHFVSNSEFLMLSRPNRSVTFDLLLHLLYDSRHPNSNITLRIKRLSECILTTIETLSIFRWPSSSFATSPPITLATLPCFWTGNPCTQHSKSPLGFLIILERPSSPYLTNLLSCLI